MNTQNHSDESYEQALDYLYSFINFERQRQDRYMASKMDPARPKKFMDALGAPNDKFPSIHIAGTKGKGSVAAMCAFCLRAAGYKVGLFTSPHLQDFRERIRILTPLDPIGIIAKSQFIDLIERIKSVAPQFPDITWFEILTAVAFLHFANEQVDVAVVEVGLGGRLDSTNVVTPLVSVITSLSLDHTKFLGNTLSQIAYEKGGIIKPGVPVISAPQPAEALDRLMEIALEREAPISVIDRHWTVEGGRQNIKTGQQELVITFSPDPSFIPHSTSFTLSLTGKHQLENATVALAALQSVRPHFAQLDMTAVREGLRLVSWPGRLQIVHHGDSYTPTLLVDCAHNPHSAQILCRALQHDYTYDRLWLIFGAPRDKDISGMLPHLASLADRIITTTASHPRSAPPDEIAELCAKLGYEAVPTTNMEEALTMAWYNASAGDLICVAGSIIVVGDLLNQWETLQSRLISRYEIT